MGDKKSPAQFFSMELFPPTHRPSPLPPPHGESFDPSVCMTTVQGMAHSTGMHVLTPPVETAGFLFPVPILLFTSF